MCWLSAVAVVGLLLAVALVVICTLQSFTYRPALWPWPWVLVLRLVLRQRRVASRLYNLWLQSVAVKVVLHRTLGGETVGPVAVGLTRSMVELEQRAKGITEALRRFRVLAAVVEPGPLDQMGAAPQAALVVQG
jgi:hypothetical protein